MREPRWDNYIAVDKEGVSRIWKMQDYKVWKSIYIGMFYYFKKIMYANYIFIINLAVQDSNFQL